MEKIKPTFSDDLIAKYELFRDKVYSPKSVFYPSCNLDVSPIKAFPDSKVTLLDIDENVTNTLNREGINAINADIRDYNPKELHDLLILLNPGFESTFAIPYIGREGYVLANNYHKNAFQLALDIKFEPIGTIIQTGKNEFSIDDAVENLDKEEWEYADRFYIFKKK